MHHESHTLGDRSGLRGEGVEDRLRRVEEILALILSRLDKLEMLVREGLGEEALTATRLVTAYSLPVIDALQAARRLLEIGRRYRLDELSRVIVEVLSDCRPRSLSEVERSVRVIRGRASRRILRERLRRLVDMGVVRDEASVNRHRYRLSNCGID